MNAGLAMLQKVVVFGCAGFISGKPFEMTTDGSESIMLARTRMQSQVTGKLCFWFRRSTSVSPIPLGARFRVHDMAYLVSVQWTKTQQLPALFHRVSAQLYDFIPMMEGWV